MTARDPFRTALARVLRPLVRAMMERGLPYPDLAELLKQLYVEVSARHFQLAGKRLTDSRISLLTGLQRKDIRALRARQETAADDAEPLNAGPLPRILARWMAGAPYSDEAGAPRKLPNGGSGEASFESLVTEISRDVHPRTMLDELIRLELVQHDSGGDFVSLVAAAYLPHRDATALLGYFGANLGDHAEAATANLLESPNPGPFYERSVHYNQLTPETLRELDAMARCLQNEVLLALNAKALELQQRDAGNDTATGRFRFGAYFYQRLEDELEGED